jgi:protein arginine kinase
VLNSRLNLSRNLESIPFPSKANKDELKAVYENIAGIITKKEFPGFNYIELSDLSLQERQSLVEKQIISPVLINADKFQGVWIKKDGKLSIMVNEEDHLNLQANFSGFQLEESWKVLSELDDKLEKHLKYAFSKDLGYLTANLTKLGTALKISITLHLPGLVLSGVLNKLVPHIQQLSLAIKGFYGDGSQAHGSLYQISNQITLGSKEEDLIEKISDIAQQIIDQEKAARAKLKKDILTIIADKVWRCYAILKHAYLISLPEALDRISTVRLGVDLGFLPHIPLEVLNHLWVEVQPANLQIMYGETPEGMPLDEKRANHIRSRMNL